MGFLSLLGLVQFVNYCSLGYENMKKKNENVTLIANFYYSIYIAELENIIVL